jgi:hypothetical protein
MMLAALSMSLCVSHMKKSADSVNWLGLACRAPVKFRAYSFLAANGVAGARPDHHRSRRLIPRRCA